MLEQMLLLLLWRLMLRLWELLLLRVLALLWWLLLGLSLLRYPVEGWGVPRQHLRWSRHGQSGTESLIVAGWIQGIAILAEPLRRRLGLMGLSSG